MNGEKFAMASLIALGAFFLLACLFAFGFGGYNGYQMSEGVQFKSTFNQIMFLAIPVLGPMVLAPMVFIMCAAVFIGSLVLDGGGTPDLVAILVGFIGAAIAFHILAFVSTMFFGATGFGLGYLLGVVF
jgi:hypothetical protein